jgi:hypothetical protein
MAGGPRCSQVRERCGKEAGDINDESDDDVRGESFDSVLLSTPHPCEAPVVSGDSTPRFDNRLSGLREVIDVIQPFDRTARTVSGANAIRPR